MDVVVVVVDGGDEAVSVLASFISVKTLYNNSFSSNVLGSRLRNSDIIIVRRRNSSTGSSSINDKSTVLVTFGLGSSDAEAPLSTLSDDEDGGAASSELLALFAFVVVGGVSPFVVAGAGAGTLALCDHHWQYR